MTTSHVITSSRINNPRVCFTRLDIEKIKKSVPDWAKEEEGLLDELGIEESIRNCGD